MTKFDQGGDINNFVCIRRLGILKHYKCDDKV